MLYMWSLFLPSQVYLFTQPDPALFFQYFVLHTQFAKFQLMKKKYVKLCGIWTHEENSLNILVQIMLGSSMQLSLN